MILEKTEQTESAAKCTSTSSQTWMHALELRRRTPVPIRSYGVCARNLPLAHTSVSKLNACGEPIYFRRLRLLIYIATSTNAAADKYLQSWLRQKQHECVAVEKQEQDSEYVEGDP